MNKKLLVSILSLLAVFSMVLASCAPAATPTAVATEAPTQPPAPTEAPKFKACQVTDTGGIDDKSFNATAWKGVQDAMAQLGIEGKYLESQQQTDYEKNINAFLDEKCDIIITVGFLIGDATKAAAEANPDAKFSIVDFAYDPVIPNVLGQVFTTDQAAFLAGYLAAGVSKTGKVGTFGGIQIPTVTTFMDGFALGVDYYNKQKGTKVEVLGWDPAAQTGLFTGNFESTDDGRTMGETLMDEGADIIMPVAGPVGLGTAAAIQERGNAYVIGVDSDWYLTAPDYKAIILTSVLKNMDITTFDAIKSVMDGTFKGGVTVGTLENNGVGLASFHDLESMVPAELSGELDSIKADIIAGKIPTSPGAMPAAPTEAATTAPVVEATVAPTVPAPNCTKMANAVTPKAGDLGSPEKPIVIAFVPSGDTGKITTAGTTIADCLTQMTGLTFQIEVGTSFRASADAMGADKAQVGFLNTFTVLLAEKLYSIVPIMAVVRNYKTNEVDPDKNLAGTKQTFYKAEFLANVDSGINSLADLKGKSFCFVDPASTSGYIIPRMILKQNGIDPDKDFSSVQNAGSHDNVAIAVYKGDCDAGVAYVDIRNDETANLKATYPDIMDKVKVFYDSIRIPNDGIQVTKDFPAEYSTALTDALTALSADPGGIAMLKSLYNAVAYEKIDPTFYDEFLKLCTEAGPDLCPLPQ
jgi:basic membrane protein A and related proteins